MGKECGARLSRRLWGGSNTSVLKTTAWEATLIGDTFQIELEFRSIQFLRRGENRSTRRKASEQGREPTQPTYGTETGNRTRATLDNRS